MTTFNTGNPVPSADARDRFDNSQAFDEVINGTLTYYPNRIGANILSLRGMQQLFETDQAYRQEQFDIFMQSSGYETPVPYAAGILVQRYTQLIEKDGEFYKPAAGSIPFTTTGVWATDSANLVAVGDAALRASLAASSGSDMVSFIQSGTGAVTRTSQNKMRDVVSVKDFGAIGDGVTDDTASFLAALSLVATTGQRLYVPAGRYLVTSPITVSNTSGKSIVIEGDFSDSSEIMLNTGGDGITFNISGNWWGDLSGVGGAGVRLSHIRFSTNNSVVGTGLSIVGQSLQGRPQVPVLLEYVQFSSNTGLDKGWALSTRIQDTGAVKLYGSQWIVSNLNTGNALYLGGTAQINSPVHFNITDCIFTYGNIQIHYDDFVEGVYISGCTMIASNYGVYCSPSQGESGLQVINSHMSCVQSCIYMINMFDVVITGNLFYRNGTGASYSAIKVMNGGRIAITGNVFNGLNNNTFPEIGVYLASTINDIQYGGLVTGNTYHNYASQAVWVGADCNYMKIGDSQYRNCAMKVLNQQVNKNNIIDIAGYTGSIICTLVGGALYETIDIPLPTGLFSTKAETGFISSLNTETVGTYQYDSASTTATNARVLLRSIPGSNILAGPNRIAFSFTEGMSATVY